MRRKADLDFQPSGPAPAVQSNELKRKCNNLKTLDYRAGLPRNYFYLRIVH